MQRYQKVVGFALTLAVVKAATEFGRRERAGSALGWMWMCRGGAMIVGNAQSLLLADESVDLVLLWRVLKYSPAVDGIKGG
jgi:hypothetical protein